MKNILSLSDNCTEEKSEKRQKNKAMKSNTVTIRLRKEFGKVLFILFCILTSQPSIGQNNEWAIGYGSTLDDYGQIIKKDIAGNIYVAGVFQGTVNFGSVSLTSNGGYDIFITKYSSSGNFLWAKKIGGTSSDNVYSMAFDHLCNFYMTGSFYSTVDFNPGAGTNQLTSAGSMDIFFAKYDSAGNYIWAKRIGGTTGDEANSISYLTGKIYITGYFTGTNVDFDPGTGTNNLSSLGSNDAFFAKYDTSGSFVFAKSIGGINSEIGRSVALDNNGNIYLTGQFGSPNVDFDGPGSAPNLTATAADVYIAKYTPAGNYIWARQINGTNSEIGYNISVSGKNLYLTGSLGSTNVDFDFSGSTALLSTNSAGVYDIFIAKYDTACNYKWARNFGGNSTYADEGKSITSDDLGNVYITGYFSGSIVNFNPGGAPAVLNSSGGQEIFIAKYDSLGSNLWANNIGSSAGDDNGLGLYVDNERNVYFTGGFTGTNTIFGYNPDAIKLTSNGNKDIFLCKYTDQATKVYFREVIPGSFKIKFNKGFGGKRVIFVTKNMSNPPILTDKHTYTANAIFGSGEEVGSTGWYCVYNGDKDSIVVTGLSEGATCKAMIYEYTGTAGNEIYNNYLAIGNPASQTVPYSQPSTQATNLVFSQVRDTSFTVSWDNGNGTNRVVFVREGNTGNVTLSDSTPYYANTKYGSGSNIISTNWYCVYNGTGSTVTVWGLTNLKAYTVQVCEYNGILNLVNYNTSTSATNPKIVQLVDKAPSVQVANLLANYTNDVKDTSINYQWAYNGNMIVFAEEGNSGDASPVDFTNYTANEKFSFGSQIGTSGWYCVYKGTAKNTILRNLTPNTTYKIQAFSYNNINPGSEKYLTTISSGNTLIKTTDFSSPTIQASNVLFSNKSDTSATISWTNGNGTGRVVFMAKDVGIGLILINDSTYAGNSNYAIAANGSSGFVCVYNGNGNSFNVTGLAPNTQYYVRVCEYLGEPDRETFNVTGSNVPLITKNTTIINFAESIDTIYTSPDFNPGATTNSGNSIVYSSSDPSIATIISSKVHVVKTGNCKIYAIDNGNSTYAAAKDSAVLTVKKSQLYIKTVCVDRNYGSNNNLSYLTVGLRSTDIVSSVNLSTSATISSDTGKYTVISSDAVLSAGSLDNYNVNYLQSVFTINPASLTITADNKSREYGIDNPTLTYTVTGLKVSDAISSVNLSTNATTSSIKGNYPIVPSSAIFSSGKSSNYSINYINGTMSVTAAPLSVTVDNKNRLYGSSNPLFTFKSTGLRNGDSIKSISMSTLTTIACDTGTYTIDGSLANFAIGSETNYSITYNDGKLKIMPTPLSISLKDSPAEKFYADANPAFKFEASGLKNSDSIVSLVYTTTASLTSDTGTYNVTLSDPVFKTGNKASNYSITYNTGKIKVKPAAAVVKALATTRTYGELNPTFKWQVTGLKNSDSIKQVTLTCSADPRSALGDYQIVPSNPVFETGKASNYSIAMANGTLTVVKSPIEICLVSVDMETGSSMIVWERNNSAGLKGYNIYRQSSQLGEYEKIGNVPITDPGIFLDATSSIEKHAELYKITTIDNNSVESRLDQCNYHKSLFLQYAGADGGVNLNWQPYEVENSVINFKSYVIYKGSDSTKLTVVDTIASNIYNYTDNDPLATVYRKFYRIAGIKYSYCYPEGQRKAGAGPFLESISNLEDNRIKASQAIPGDIKLYDFEIVVNPNPVRNISTIRYILPQSASVEATIINMLGKTVATINVGNQLEGNAQFYIDARALNLSKGLYYLKVSAGRYEATSKISVVR